MSAEADVSDLTPTERVFHQYPCFETSAEVWAVLFARHGDELEPISSFSDPTGTFAGGTGDQGRMETCYRLRGADLPLLGVRTTWDIGKNDEQINKRHQYFLIIARCPYCDDDALNEGPDSDDPDDDGPCPDRRCTGF